VSATPTAADSAPRAYKVALSESTHQKLKIWAAQRKESMQSLAEKIIDLAIKKNAAKENQS
jgi:hypothetical protein